MEPALLSEDQIAALAQNFFPEFANVQTLPERRLVQGVIFDFDHTLAYLARPLEELMAEGAKAAEAYMRQSGMDDLPIPDKDTIVELLKMGGGSLHMCDCSSKNAFVCASPKSLSSVSTFHGRRRASSSFS